MWSPSRYSGFRFFVIVLTSVTGLLFLYHSPCGANIAPESALLLHVQPYSGSCETPLTKCDQIIRSTSADGPLEFLLFFMRGTYDPWPGEEICLESLEWCVLAWPAGWQLLEFDPCAGTGRLDPAGSGGVLHVHWSEYPASGETGGIVVVARLVMNVVGPGQLDIASSNGIVLRHDCYGSTFVSYPARVGAEAGMECGYVTPHCGYAEQACVAHFYVPELLLSAPVGGGAEDTVAFWATPPAGVGLCPLTVEPHAPWCSGWIEPAGNGALLHVTADASGLEMGTHETEIELVSSMGGGYQGTSRCLPVEFTVEEPTSVLPMSWGHLKAAYH
jgi:hypothetical protein